jgi:hypothetical protein
MFNAEKARKYQNKYQKKKHYIGYYLDILYINACIKYSIKHSDFTGINITQNDLSNPMSMYKEYYKRKGFTAYTTDCPLDSETFLIIKWG